MNKLHRFDRESASNQSWPSAAKINRFLHIIGQREDGYHLLQSVFQFVDFCDYLKFDLVPDGSICLNSPISGIPEKQNLVIKAANLLKQHCQSSSSTNLGVCITLEKHIPMGAGLGGGSSNAATTLLALNLLWDCHLSNQQLAKLGIQLGADVPFFIYGQNAFVEGIGEKVTPINIDLPWLQLAIPDCHISTEEVFHAKDLSRDSDSIDIQQLKQLPKNHLNQHLLGNFGKNDCQATVLKHYSAVKSIFNKFKHHNLPRLTGTGSCLFSLFDSKSQAANTIPSLDCQSPVLIKNTLDRSPLQAILEKYNDIPQD